jgi:phosphoethanolamine N-methyltransferase
MMSGDENVEYTEDFIRRLELTFGKGFLSPGGEEEVSKIVEGIDLEGKTVLDIGVGLGGPACLLVGVYGAGHVMGIDVEDPVIERAAATVESHGLSDRITLKRVAPGKLPFDDESFDVVFSKDTIVHIPDKLGLFDEIRRVLKPGGWVVMSDWYCDEKPFTKEMAAWVESIGLSFAMAPIGDDKTCLEQAGFVDCAALDRNEWFTKYSRMTVDRLRGPDYEDMVASLGKEGAEDWLSRAEMRVVISAQGQLRPGHLRGRKPG